MENNNKNAYIYALIIVVVVVGGVVFSKKGEQINVEDSTNKVLEEARSEEIDFELENYVGEVVERKDFKTKITVVNVWASWCPFCVNELPDFATLQNEFKDSVSVVAINRAEPTPIAKSFSDNLNLGDGIVFLVDPTDKFYKTIGGFSMPETLFLDKKGNILLHKKGPMSIEEMRKIINSNLEK